MKPIKPILLTFIAIIAFLYLCGCTFTQTYTVQLSNKPHPALDSLNKKYGFEQVELTGKKTSEEGDSTYTELTIKCINGKNIPSDDDEMKALAKQIASQVKHALNNPNEFENYRVLFDAKEESLLSTSENSNEEDFQSTELSN